MAVRRIEIVLALVLVVALWEGTVDAQSSCTNVIISMSPCLDYITGNSSTPSSPCCSQFANVVSSQPKCLCEVLNGGSSSVGVNINQTQALALPSACKVQTPPISRCSGSSPPPGSLAGAPTSPSGSRSKTVPSPSDGNSNKMAFPLLFFLLFIASYASTSTDN
ncbi:unnamed protein product [Prunus armeniaca]|uniref:Bifunctional inhibitor/plant lipid transfer protein/seed storage helical domain-containing protein n=1 Tax=Prunus armeniaca TaxID=36596 RepID=A0A6J5VTJ2_PRUAR|nr:hypothetical protein GBA52_028101 [Prunus armeniaca]CAB4291673.1 unnamed protein product [Prunus armeniaca]CAB4321987.1 unnamed protein product [Prunus armeniaca]